MSISGPHASTRSHRLQQLLSGPRAIHRPGTAGGGGAGPGCTVRAERHAGTRGHRRRAVFEYRVCTACRAVSPAARGRDRFSRSRRQHSAGGSPAGCSRWRCRRADDVVGHLRLPAQNSPARPLAGHASLRVVRSGPPRSLCNGRRGGTLHWRPRTRSFSAFGRGKPCRPGSGVVCRDGASICVRALADKRWFPGRASAIGVGPCRITGVLATASGRVGQTPREAFPARRAKP